MNRTFAVLIVLCVFLTGCRTTSWDYQRQKAYNEYQQDRLTSDSYAEQMSCIDHGEFYELYRTLSHPRHRKEGMSFQRPMPVACEPYRNTYYIQTGTFSGIIKASDPAVIPSD